METLITDAMAGLVGQRLETRISYPVSASDIRRWALAVYYPAPPPRQFFDVEWAAASAWRGIVAPADFNPFAWSSAEVLAPAVAPIDADRAYVAVGATEHLLGVAPPALTHGLNGGIEVLFGATVVRPGDVITSEAAISAYRERQGRLGRMLFTTTDHVWTNQRHEHVKTLRLTYIRY